MNLLSENNYFIIQEFESKNNKISLKMIKAEIIIKILALLEILLI